MATPGSPRSSIISASDIGAMWMLEGASRHLGLPMNQTMWSPEDFVSVPNPDDYLVGGHSVDEDN